MMRVNKAITRLGNKKQMETDNLYMPFVFYVMRMRRTTRYINITADIQAGTRGFLGLLVRPFNWSERPRRFGWVFSRARLCRHVGLGICLNSLGRGVIQLIVWEKWT